MATYERPISPTQLQRVLPDQSLGSVAYHIRVLASAGMIELADETRVRGAVEHYYALVADVAAEFVDPIARLQTLCGELMEMDPVSGFPRAVEPDEDTQTEAARLLGQRRQAARCRDHRRAAAALSGRLPWPSDQPELIGAALVHRDERVVGTGV